MWTRQAPGGGRHRWLAGYRPEDRNLRERRSTVIKVDVREFIYQTLPLSAEAAGALWRLCLHAWNKSPGPSLPTDDDEALARLAGVPLARWRWIAKQVLSLLTEDGQVSTRFLGVSEIAPAAGYVYVLQNLDQPDEYKIGFSANPQRRQGSLKAEGFKTRAICQIPALDMRQREAELHARFASCRVRGEWFCLQDDDLSWLIEQSEEEG